MPIAKPRSAAPQTRATARPAPRTPSAADRLRVLDVPYAHRAVAAAAGARWDPALRAHVFAGGGELPAALRPYVPPPYSWEAYRQDLLDGAERPPSTPSAGFVPHPHQVDCAAAMTRAARAGRTATLLADDVGMGKTASAWLSALEAHPDHRDVLVVCPLGAVAQWRRTIAAVGDGGRRVVVINYDRMKALFEVPDAVRAAARGKRRKGRKAARVRTLKGVARHGEPAEFDLAIFDESHRLKNLQSARSKLALALYEACDAVMWLSATAGQTPLELGYLYPLLMEATGDRKSDLLAWEEWCRGRGIGVARGAYGKWVWEPADREADLRLMRDLLYGGAVPAGLRREVGDVAGWPEKVRVLLPVALDPDDRVHYRLAWDEFRAALSLPGTRPDKGGGLVAALRFRQKGSLLRTAATVDLVEDLLAQGRQVAVSVAFLETLAVIRDALAAHGVAVLSGGQSAGEREAERLRFQRGEARVCVYTVTEAVSLHEGEEPGGGSPRANVIHDLRWSGIDMHQIEGRTHRDGRASVAYWCMAEGTIEESVADVVVRRVASMADLQGDEATSAAIAELLRGM